MIAAYLAIFYGQLGGKFRSQIIIMAPEKHAEHTVISIPSSARMRVA